MNLEKSLAAFPRQWEGGGPIKLAEDLARYETLLTDVDAVLECGTHEGASANWFAERVDRVITIDVNPVAGAGVAPGADGAHRGRLAPNVEWIHGSSTDPAVIWRVYDALAGRRVLVSLDSWHSGPHVFAEMLAYSALARWLVVEDGIIRWIPNELAYYGGTGPLDAIERFRRVDGHFETQNDLEDQDDGVTMHPGGWLKRR